MMAVMQGDTDLVKALLSRKGQANRLDVQGNSPLNMAVRSNKLEIVRCLLESGSADPTISDCRERTLLSRACCEQNKPILFDLLKLTLSKNHDFLNHCSCALNAAAAAPFGNDNFGELVRIDKIGLDRADDDGLTSMHTCWTYQHPRKIEVLDTAMLLAWTLTKLREPDLKSPSAWHPLDKSPCIKILEDGLTVEIADRPFCPFGTYEDSAVVRADHCMPGHGKYYFEVTIEEDAYHKYGISIPYSNLVLDLEYHRGKGSRSY
ncbi:hypothetical protein J3459_017148 [Metarhizium acridum]|nr:hypothetical protein J3459_017148 [Metarhizium acridum]